MAASGGWQEDLSILANVLEVLGFIATVWIAVSVRNLRKDYRFRGMVPGLAARLEERLERLTECLGQFHDPGVAKSIGKELALCEATLGALSGYLGKRRNEDAQQVLILVRNYEKGSRTEDELRRIYNRMHKVNQQVQDVLEALRWGEK